MQEIIVHNIEYIYSILSKFNIELDPTFVNIETDNGKEIRNEDTIIIDNDKSFLKNKTLATKLFILEHILKLIFEYLEKHFKEKINSYNKKFLDIIFKSEPILDSISTQIFRSKPEDSKSKDLDTFLEKLKKLSEALKEITRSERINLELYQKQKDKYLQDQDLEKLSGILEQLLN